MSGGKSDFKEFCMELLIAAIVGEDGLREADIVERCTSSIKASTRVRAEHIGILIGQTAPLSETRRNERVRAGQDILCHEQRSVGCPRRPEFNESSTHLPYGFRATASASSVGEKD